jgi:transposase
MSRPFGTATELERRRRRAVAAVNEGESPEAVARILGVNRTSIYRWLKAAEQFDGLAAKLHPGRPPLLSPEQLRRLEDILLLGPKAHGWHNQLWTCARIVEVIRSHFHIEFHHDHVGRILRERLNWSPHKPEKRARERDEKAIEDWKRIDFPRLAAAARDRDAHLVFLDESGYMLTPTVRRGWAPRGREWVLDSWDRRDRISAISCITVSPKDSRLNLYFRLLNHNAHAEDVVDFLRELKNTLRRPFTVLWDRSKIHHKSRAARAFLAEHPEIIAEDLPAYAPQLNPDELVWNWTKYGRLSNLAADDTDQLAERLVDEMMYLKQHPSLLASFVEKTELQLAA